MGAILTLLCVTLQLLVWDVELKLRQAISRPHARAHLDRVVSLMAHRLLVLARIYGGLSVDIDPALARSVPSPAIVVANHQSVADIVVLLDALRVHRLRFVAKKELGHGFPAVSEVLRIQRHALIDRTGDFRRGAAELHRLGRETRAGVSPAIFPEGTRSRTGEVRTFHPGAVRTILSEANVPIVAVAVDGGYRFVSFKDILKGLATIMYRARLVGTFHHDGSKAGVRDALADAERAVRDQIDSWRAADQTTSFD